jgi:transposase InsO family protein
MPWSGTVEEQRREFYKEFTAPGANRSAVCEVWGVSRKAGYDLVKRYQERGEDAFGDRSRRPLHSPAKIGAEMEARVLAIREEEPSWGGRKIRRRLEDLKVRKVPAASTITAILQRNGRIDPAESVKRKPFTRFERARPNELWQMDFKGHFALGNGARCHPLTILDDHSRYCIELGACENEQRVTVQDRLTRAFERNGLPEEMLMDNGPPWGTEGRPGYTKLEVWLMRLDIRVTHGRPRHPQTQGKEERFHRTFVADVVRRFALHDFTDAQGRFDWYRPRYNEIRPHEALGLAVPASRYHPSQHRMPERVPAVAYDPGETVRKVQDSGWISYQGREWRISKAFHGFPLAIRGTEVDGEVAVYFCRQQVAVLELRTGKVRLERG